ncbi:hypothetical protein L6164_037813 [Bauhinia variegata]|uniref:Uncharacterized protein n=1 Tax=Bauhinia variegata TaxID=167791 RepID=A0ACB9KL98_BAUVA|nr:hypothetical protein L6164_037813 [Bauhinia variegata]
MMLHEHHIDRIMELSPYSNIREEAYSFLEDRLKHFNSLEHDFQRHLMDAFLQGFKNDLDHNGRQSDLYQKFYSHFTDENFRRAIGLPLP